MIVSTSGPRRTRRPRRADASTWKGWTRSSVGWALRCSAGFKRRLRCGGKRRRRRLSAEAPGEDALLSVEAVLGLVPHHRLRPVDHPRRHLLAALGGKAMHE